MAGTLVLDAGWEQANTVCLGDLGSPGHWISWFSSTRPPWVGNLDFLIAWWSQDGQTSSVAAGFPEVKIEMPGLSLKFAPYHICYLLLVIQREGAMQGVGVIH